MEQELIYEIGNGEYTYTVEITKEDQAEYLMENAETTSKDVKEFLVKFLLSEYGEITDSLLKDDGFIEFLHDKYEESAYEDYELGKEIKYEQEHHD